ncbi:FHA domain-containing protein [Pleionea sp. CnH1-48]|uniref:FHA domain-containing protein n=1 Tax=Pleionea sp. CnH1-48 TaxID=2954494 RepID=UPI0020971BBA|nr:FHA domain-containing protein [Pleionea sp. CnH1-48]MCO7223696.1 FHA domain-containing protein [Pleionea sp. CnH1-48]
MNLVIEEINRTHKVIKRHKINNTRQVSIGRAFDNDIILTEPHVSPHHMVLIEDDTGQWLVHDNNSQNGIRNTKRQLILSGSVIQSGDSLQLGRAYIRIWDEKHPVEDTWKLDVVDDVFHSLSSIWLAMILVTTFVLGEWALNSFASSNDLSAHGLSKNMFYQLIFIGIWSLLWSLAGRIVRHESRFVTHLSITVMAALLFQWSPIVLKIISYNALLGLWIREIQLVLNGAIFALLLWCNLYLTVPQKPLTRMITANSVAWGIVLLFLLPAAFESQDYRDYPRYDSTILPPSVLWQTPESSEHFVEQQNSLYQQTALTASAARPEFTEDKESRKDVLRSAPKDEN